MAEVNPNSKQQRAIRLVLEGKKLGKSRKILIQEIREVCNMSDAGAATYYQNAVSKLRDQGILVKTTIVVVDKVVEPVTAPIAPPVSSLDETADEAAGADAYVQGMLDDELAGADEQGMLDEELADDEEAAELAE
jgi:hypothetical protein